MSHGPRGPVAVMFPVVLVPARAGVPHHAPPRDNHRAIVPEEYFS